MHDYSKSSQLISLKLDVMIGPSSQKKVINFWWWSGPGSLFHFPHHCRIGDFGRFISISHIVMADFHDTWQND